MTTQVSAFPRPRRWAGLVVLAVALSLAATGLDAQRSAVPAKPDTATISHVLNRIGFGARPGDIERIKQIGLAAYIDQQLQPERVNNDALVARLAEFETLAMSSRELTQKYILPADQARQQVQRQQAQQAQMQPPPDPTMAPNPNPRPQLPPEVRMLQQQAQNVTNELMQAKMLRAAMSEHQLEEVLVDFWFNHFNVFIGKGQVRQYLTDYEMNVIRPHVFGNFRELLGATAHSAAMLFYLDNFQSQAPAGAPTLNGPDDFRGRGGVLRPGQPGQRPGAMFPNPRRPGQIGVGRGRGLPGQPGQPGQVGQPGQPGVPPRPQPQRPQRGLNENYARELMELHTLGVDGGYTQKDVVELARILTGWTIDQPRQGGAFLFRPQSHDAGEKTLLEQQFKAGGGQEEGERALDILASHPSTARHISFKLAQRFVADEPPKALVDRAAKTFTDTKGDLRAVVRTIITSPEFFAPTARRAKVKTPFEFVVSAVRATGATIVNAQPLVGAMRTLGMPLYGCQPPTGYSMTADAWVNTGALLNRMNFVVQLVGGGGQMPRPNGREGRPNAPAFQPVPPPGQPAQGNQPAPPDRPFLRQLQQGRMPLQVDIQQLAPDTSEASRERLINTILAGQVADTTRQTLARAESSQQLVALTLGSPEFQRR